jgi:hypothetical protein
MAEQTELAAHDILVSDFNSIISDGLDAMVLHPAGKTARDVCSYFLKLAYENAEEDEKQYLWLIKKRVEDGNLSQLIRERVLGRAQKAGFLEAVRSVYSTLIKCLANNQPFL